MSSGDNASGGVWNVIKENGLLLVAGTLLALLWAYINYESYYSFTQYVISTNNFVGHPHDGHRELTVKYLINDIGMALFFAFAAKEVWEAIALKNGKLRGKQAATPVIATIGGVAGPVVVYLGLASAIGAMDEAGDGWAIPTATDIAFSYLIGRVVFGKKHPAVAFLLLLAIVDDAIGLGLIARFYPKEEIQPIYMLLPIAAMVFNYLVLNRVLRVMNFWPYLLIGGTISWFGFQFAGVHPALGLLPIIVTMPHADSDLGIFAREERNLDDTLNQFEHRMDGVVQLVLFAFALVNAGVELSAFGNTTWLVLAGLGIGKPFGILIFGAIAARFFGLSEGMTLKDLFVVGWIAAIGFTVALFVSDAAFSSGPVLEAAKMGALASFIFALIAIIIGRLCKVQRVTA